MDIRGEVDLKDLRDEYREAVEEVIAAKAAGEGPPESPEPVAGGKVLDLTAALEGGVRAAKESRGEEAEVHDLPQRKRTASRATPKETGAKKSTSTAKKAAAKKTTQRKRSAWRDHIRK
jgi:DNA end-binding protein Ku